MQLVVIGCAIGDDTRGRVLFPNAFQSPLTVDKTDVAKVEVVLKTHGAEELSNLMLKLENPVAAIDHEELPECVALLILAVGEPREPISHFTPPRHFSLLHSLPVNFLDIAKAVEAEIHRYTQLFLAFRLVKNVSDDRKLLQSSVRSLIPIQVSINLVDSVHSVVFKTRVILLLVCLLVSLVALLFILQTEDLV